LQILGLYNSLLNFYYAVLVVIWLIDHCWSPSRRLSLSLSLSRYHILQVSVIYSTWKF